MKGWRAEGKGVTNPRLATNLGNPGPRLFTYISRFDQGSLMILCYLCQFASISKIFKTLSMCLHRENVVDRVKNLQRAAHTVLLFDGYTYYCDDSRYDYLCSQARASDLYLEVKPKLSPRDTCSNWNLTFVDFTYQKCHSSETTTQRIQQWNKIVSLFFPMLWFMAQFSLPINHLFCNFREHRLYGFW